MNEKYKRRVVVVGGGFGGLEVARKLHGADVQITLLDRRNFHLFQPLLYQVATGALSPANIAAPLRAVLKRHQNTQVLLGEASGFDVDNHRVLLSDGDELPYDFLVVAAGVRHHYFGNPQWEALAPGLKTLEDATNIRARVLYAFEAAERETDPAEVARLLTFVVVGAGPTGVEMAGAIAEIAHFTLRENFRAIDPSAAKVILIEGTDRVLPSYPPGLSANAQQALERLKVSVRTQSFVTNVSPEGVTIKSGDHTEMIEARNVIWAAGVQGSPLGTALAQSTGAELDKFGRVMVEPDLSLPNHPEIFVIGDMSHLKGKDGKPLPGVAPVAQQQGRYVARLIRSQLQGKNERRPFRYFDKGSMATIGRAAAVADLHIVRFAGMLGWMAWLFIHLMSLVRFQNRILVLLQWAWSYFTRNRSARLITVQRPPQEQPDALQSGYNKVSERR